MTQHAHLEMNLVQPLIAERFTPEKLAKVAGFDCTDKNCHPWEMYLNAWIKEDAPTCVKQGKTRVWLYYSGEELVGYGSLGLTTIEWPYRTRQRQSQAFIPAFAISRWFRGKPRGGKREDRFAWRAMSDLVSRATVLRRELLTLYVDKQNNGAQRFYKNFGFAMVGECHDHYVMALNIRRLGFAAAIDSCSDREPRCGRRLVGTSAIRA